MATLLLKKSYLLNSLKEVPFKDLWGSRGVFTTMRMIEKPPRLLLLKPHMDNLIYSAKKYHKCNQTDPDPKGLLLYVINESKKYLWKGLNKSGKKLSEGR